VAELTLAVLLFADAATVALRDVEADVSIPARLLFVGLPLTMLAGTLIARIAFPGDGWATSALIAVIHQRSRRPATNAYTANAADRIAIPVISRTPGADGMPAGSPRRPGDAFSSFGSGGDLHVMVESTRRPVCSLDAKSHPYRTRRCRLRRGSLQLELLVFVRYDHDAERRRADFSVGKHDAGRRLRRGRPHGDLLVPH
ncbi:MAG: hypothetical protein ACJ76P_13410, partial [Actinomycetota bacterium]